MAEYSNPNPSESVVLNVSKLEAAASSDYIRRICIVSVGDTTITTGEIQEISSDEVTDIFDTSTDDYLTTETYLNLVAYFANNSNGTVNVFEAGAVVDSDPTDNIGVLSDFITAGISLCYWYVCPEIFYGNAAFVTLMSGLSGYTDATYFAFMITYGETPTSSTDFADVVGYKAAFAVYPTESTDTATVGEMAGIVGSSKYDISSSNKLTMLQWKKLANADAEDLTTSFQTDLVNNAVNFVGTKIGYNVIFNGRYLDNTAFDYWYAWDKIMLDLQTALETAMYNSSNTPSAVIQYNQNGINKLLNIINNVLNTGIKEGTITAFSETVDDTGTVMENTGTFLATDFQTYKSDYPSNYAAGIYDGFSGYIEIGKFFRKVTLNITLT